MGWVKSVYGENEIGKVSLITTLELRAIVNSKYNIFKGHNGKYFVIFGDQPDLLEYAMAVEKGLFLVKILRKDNIKYSYHVVLDGEDTEVFTIGRLKLLLKEDAGITNILVDNDKNIIMY